MQRLTALSLTACLLLLSACGPKISLGPDSSFSTATMRSIEVSLRSTGVAIAGGGAITDPRFDGELRQEYAKVMSTCSQVLSKFEAHSEALQWTKIALATIGAAAGSIVVPVLTATAASANAEAISAFGGVSGLINGVQGALSETGLTPAESLMTREQIRSKFFTKIEEYYTELGGAAPNYGAAAAKLDAAKAQCVLYAINVKAVEEPKK